MNPVNLLDSLLDNYVPTRYRRVVHGVILMVGVIVAALMAADGDWKKAGVSLAVALYAAANKANTIPLDPAGTDDGSDDGLSYEEAGGADFPEEHPEDDTEPSAPSVSGNLS